MKILINHEFLISPVLSDEDIFIELVEEVIHLASIISEEGHPFYIENDAANKMRESGFYPCDKIFLEIIKKIADFPYTAKDIVNRIFRIINKAIPIDLEEITYDVEWEIYSLTPSLNCCSASRSSDLKKYHEDLLLQQYFDKKTFCNLHYHENKNIKSEDIILNGVIKEIYPSKPQLPMDIAESSTIYYRIRSCLNDLDGFKLYQTATSDAELKLSLYIGTLQLISSSNPNYSISWSNFDVGSELFQSLTLNDGANTQLFSNTTYQAIIHVLADVKKYETAPFYTDSTRKTQKTHDNYLAYRTHVTKRGRALRLMYWNNNKKIIISNIGNKNELIIYTPPKNNSLR